MNLLTTNLYWFLLGIKNNPSNLGFFSVPRLALYSTVSLMHIVRKDVGRFCCPHRYKLFSINFTLRHKDCLERLKETSYLLSHTFVYESQYIFFTFSTYFSGCPLFLFFCFGFDFLWICKIFEHGAS